MEQSGSSGFVCILGGHEFCWDQRLAILKDLVQKYLQDDHGERAVKKTSSLY